MGMDLSYQAIPDRSPALERARRDGLFGSDLEFWSRTVAGDSMLAKTATEMAAMARRAAIQHPGIESRRLNWGRSYDAVHYLLSEARPLHGGHWQSVPDWAGEAIYGAQVLHPNAVTTIGFKIRYTPPELVREHAELLQLVTQDDLREYFDAAAMARCGVYKYFGDPEEFENWMWPQFEEWRDFLLSMQNFPDEGLLCCIS